MKDDQPAGDRTREKLLAIVREHRGVHKSDLCRLAGHGWGNVGHHVDVLERQALVQTEARGRLLWIFDTKVSERDRAMIVALRPSPARRILQALGLQPKATIRSLSDELSVSKKVIRHHLSVLKRMDVVEQLEGHPPAYARAKK